MSKNSFVEQHYGIARVEIVEVGEEDSDEYDEEDLGIAMRRDEHINMESIQRIINGVVPPRQEDEAEEEEDEDADKENMENEDCGPEVNSDQQVSNLESMCDEKRLPSEENEIYYDSSNVEEMEIESEEEQFEDCLDSETCRENSSSEENKKCFVISDKGNETYKEMEEGRPDVPTDQVPAEQLSTEDEEQCTVISDDENQTYEEMEEGKIDDHDDKAHSVEQLSTEDDEEPAEISADDNNSVEENLIILSSSSSNYENESGSSCYGDEEESESSIEEIRDTAGGVSDGQSGNYQSDETVDDVEVFEDVKKFSDEKAEALKKYSITSLPEEKTSQNNDPKPGDDSDVQLVNCQSDVETVDSLEVFKGNNTSSNDKAESLKEGSTTLAEEKTSQDNDAKPGDDSDVQLVNCQFDTETVDSVEVFKGSKSSGNDKAESLKEGSTTLAEEKTSQDNDAKPDEEDSIDKKDPSVEADKKDSSVQADKEHSSTEPSKIAEQNSALKENDGMIQSKKVDRLASQPKQMSEHSSSIDEVQSINKNMDFDTEDISVKRTLQKVPVDRMGSVKRKRKVRKNKKPLERLPREESASSSTEDDNSKCEEETDPSTRVHFKKFLRRRYNSELSHPRFRKPLELGWVRELVYRNMNSSKRTRFADVYYYTPKGRKLRSSVQVKQFLTAGLTLKNFTFAKESLGINDNVREIVRSARISLRSKIVDSHKRALANSRRIKELKRYMKTAIFPLKRKPSSFLSLHRSKAKKGKFSDEFERDSENGSKHSSDEYSDSDDYDTNIIKSYTCTQKCPKALHFIPTIKCIQCEMKFHPQCEEIPPDNESDIEDIRPIVDYVCRKCTLFNHRNAGEPLRHTLSPIATPPPIIFPPPVFQLVFALPGRILTPTPATQLAGINQEVNSQQLPVDENVNINSSTEADNVEMQVLSPASVSLGSGSESDENPTIEGSETDEVQNTEAMFAENDSLISEKHDNEAEVVSEDIVSFSKQDGGVLLLAGEENNLNDRHFETEQQYIISQINPEIAGDEHLVNTSESNFSFVINEGESNHTIQQQDDTIMEELIAPQVEPQSVSLASAKECEELFINDEGCHATNAQLIEKDYQISAAIANIADENSNTSLKETQQEESTAPNEVQTLQGMSGSENSIDQTKLSDNKKVDEVIRRKARNMKPPCNCLPSKTTDVYNCNIFSEEERAVIYHKFWKNLSWKRKKKFVDGLVEKPVRTGDKRNGEDSCIFFLEKNGERFRVCRKMFLNTLSIGEWSLNNWLKNIHDGYKPKKYWNDLILR